jgi:hypothetical protein
MMQRAQSVGDVPGATMNFSPVKKGSFSPLKATGMKKGGSAEKHEDVAEDKALIKKMVKPAARTGKNEGGPLAIDFKNAQRPSEQSEMSEAASSVGRRLSGGNRGQTPESYEPEKRGGRAKRATGGANKDKGSYWENAGLTAPEQKVINALKSHGNDYTRIGGVIHGIEPGGQMSEPIGTSVPKLREWLGYKEGGRAKRATGGQVFSGSGYPDKIPGVVPGGRTAHARGGKAKGKTNINIIIGGGKPGAMPTDPMGGPTLPPGIGAGPPGGIPVQVPPNAPPPGAGAMPMPMPIPMPGPAGPAGPPGMPMPRKSGGRAYRSYKDMDAGAGSGKGRLEKTEIAERSARKVGGRTYSSYKDMDASAANGKGRLEKAEIASKTARIEPGNY